MDFCKIDAMTAQSKIASIEKKISELLDFFSPSTTLDAKYQRLMELGQNLPHLPPELRSSANLVKGCQSELYIASSLTDGKIIFLAAADALISAGLAALIIRVYSNESPEIILTTPPLFLKTLGLLGSLSPSRSNGLAHIHQRMKIDALKYLSSDSFVKS